MAKQEPKTLIDVGEIGNASTGDILFDGGVKINSNFNQIYNEFGDQRKAANVGNTAQVIHATGYYQKVKSIPGQVAMGTMWDIDTTDGAVIVTTTRGVQGECIVFINSNGSISKTKPLEIQVVDTLLTNPTPNLTVTHPYSKITLTCVSDSGGVSLWRHKIESMFGDEIIPVNSTFDLSAAARTIPLVPTNAYKTMKLLLTCVSKDNLKFKSSEMLVYVDQKENKVYSTEYAVIRKGHANEADNLYKLDFKIENDYVNAVVSSTTQNMQLAIKVASTQSIGIPV